MKKSHFVFSIFFLLGCFSYGQAPSPTIQVSSSVICSGQTVSFTTLSSSLNTISYSWSVTPSTGVNQISNTTNSVFVLNFPNAGRFVIGLTWELEGLGTSTKTLAVTVTRSAESAFNASLTTYGYPNEVKLTDYSVASNKIYWVFDSNFSDKDSSFQTSRTYTAAGTFTVLHIAVGDKNCNDSSSYQFTIGATSSVVLPNVFTPNGDGVNDIFRPELEGISSLSVQIYNRFGIQVAAWETVNGFWDGRTASGVACDEGTYFVIAEAKGFEGKTYSTRQSLTLLR